jgi:large subunit ribosomal protein L29
MAIIKKKQLKEMTSPDLVNRYNELKLELSKERGQMAIGGSPTNPGRVRELKRTLAKILTEIKQREKKREV